MVVRAPIHRFVGFAQTAQNKIMCRHGTRPRGVATGKRERNSLIIPYWDNMRRLLKSPCNSEIFPDL